MNRDRKASKHSEALSDEQKQLLERYWDGECRWWEVWRAKRLLACSAEAQLFLNELGALRDDTHAFAQECQRACGDLWQSIVRRIEQERREEVLLGQRRTAAEAPGYPILGRLTWAALGAGVTAGLAFLLVTPGQFAGRQQVDMAYAPETGLSGSSVASGSALSSTTTVSSTGRVSSTGKVLASSKSSEPQSVHVSRFGDGFEESMGFTDIETGDGALPSTRLVARFTPRAAEPRLLPARGAAYSYGPGAGFEVDWMRSEGRLRFIEAGQGRAAVLWVKRNPSFSNSGMNEQRTRSVRSGSVNPGSAIERRAVIGPEPHIVERRVPRAVQVSE